MSLPSLQLDAFYTVSQVLNFSKAAQNLHITQSALSQRVLNLESELGTTLFIREPSGLILTEAGHKLLRYCQTRNILEEEYFSSLKSKNKSELAGIIRIAGFSSIMRSLLLPSLAPLMKENSNLSIKTITQELDQLLGLLTHSQVDYILTNENPQKENIEAIFLGYEENVLAGSKKLKTTNVYLDHDEKDATTSFYFKNTKQNTKEIKKRYLDDVYGLIDGVRLGYGKAILPKHLIEDFKDIEILDNKNKLMVSVYLLFYKQPYYTQLHNQIIKIITDYFKTILQQK